MNDISNDEDPALVAAKAPKAPGLTVTPGPLPDGTCPPRMPPAIWQLLKEANDRIEEEEERLVAILLRDYPTGVLPDWGVTMCKLYLHEEHPEDCGPDDCWLNLVQISVDDQSWALDGDSQGGVRKLISWITGRTGVSLHEEVWYAEMWYRSARVLVREELGRRAASKLP